ncbi:harpin-induced protein 1 domain containing protein [Musa troglodytarum]|uniref:Harpin-induced protein 1 domain containing protein n=1 Tax=Musa troglodytarum TaxID=320322 RepID=A0A9E7L7K0_9LILI|nr:harpin-induced protein 1 domain containing protein [Musa troglodytarum]
MANHPKPTAEPVVIGYPAAGIAAPLPSATAYAYATPRPDPYYADPRTGAAFSANRNLLLYRILIAASVAFLLVGFISFFLWLFLRPSVPVFVVSSATVSAFNLSSSGPTPQLSSSFDLALNVSNPNKKMGVNYFHVAAAVAYDGVILAETALSPFYQEGRTSTTLQAPLETRQEHVGLDVAEGISHDRATSGAVRFDVMVEAWVWFKTSAWSTSSSVMKVYCEGITISLINDTVTSGSMAGPTKQCQVNIGWVPHCRLQFDAGAHSVTSAILRHTTPHPLSLLHSLSPLSALGFPSPDPLVAMKKDCGIHGEQKRHKLYRRLFAAFLVLLILAFLAVLVVWLVLRPTKPRFYLQDADLLRFNLTPGAAPLLTSVVQVTLSSRNPNDRIGVYYDRLDAYVLYKSQQVTAATALPSGYQGHNDVTVWSPYLYGADVPLAPYLADALSQDANAGYLLLYVRVDGLLGGRWRNDI